MERNIYDRQISKQVETDGVKSLVGDEDEEDQPPKDFDRNAIKNMSDPIPGCVMDHWGKILHKNLHSTTRSSWEDKSRGNQKLSKKMRRDVTSKKNWLAPVPRSCHSHSQCLLSLLCGYNCTKISPIEIAPWNGRLIMNSTPWKQSSQVERYVW